MPVRDVAGCGALLKLVLLQLTLLELHIESSPVIEHCVGRRQLWQLVKPVDSVKTKFQIFSVLVKFHDITKNFTRSQKTQRPQKLQANANEQM